MAVNIEAMAKRYYDRGLWGADELARLVAAGKLSQEAYERITGGAAQAEGSPDLASMTKHDLLLYAQQHGVTVYESWTKDRIIEAIQSALGAD